MRNVEIATDFDPCGLIENSEIVADIGVDECVCTIVGLVGRREASFGFLNFGKDAKAQRQSIKLAVLLSRGRGAGKQRFSLAQVAAATVNVRKGDLHLDESAVITLPLADRDGAVEIRDGAGDVMLRKIDLSARLEGHGLVERRLALALAVEQPLRDLPKTLPAASQVRAGRRPWR